MSIGSFCLVRNEANWMAPHLTCWLPHLDQMVLLDGNSTDGTLEIIKEFQRSHPQGHRITLMENQDPADLRDDYVRKSDMAMRLLNTEWAFFLHPDMLSANPEAVKNVRDGIAYSTRMRSFAGEPGGQLLEIKGRGQNWKNIYRIRNPDMGAHYFGHYGAANEDVYFSAITEDEHAHYGPNLHWYPYEVKDSGLEVMHFSDVRTRERRHERMVRCLINQGASQERAESIALVHPRVTLQNGIEPTHGVPFEFVPAEYPDSFLSAYEKYSHLKEPALV